MFGFGNREEKKSVSPLQAVFVSDPGLARPDNQDNVLVSLPYCAFCVADGMGGGAEGAKASDVVCRELKMTVRVAEAEFYDRVTAAQNSLVDANYEIFNYAREHGYMQMGSTAAILIIDPVDHSRAVVINVGDSRVYRIRRGLAEKLTRDHRVSGSSTLTRAVGGGPTVRCDIKEMDVLPGDRFLVCSDGVSSVIPDGRIAVFVSGCTIESAAQRLSDAVMKAGAPDNFSFIIVAV